MERALLWSLLAGVWVAMAVMEHVMPQLSALLMVVGFLILYSWLLSAAQVHRKRKERKGKLPAPAPLADEDLPSVTIIVPAHNEEAVIARAVETFLSLDYPRLELVVVDDRSTDRTGQILATLAEEFAGLQAKGKHFRWVRRPDDALPGKSVVLNEVLADSTGEVLAVFDADALVAPDFLRKMMPFLVDPDVGAVQARKIIANADTNWLTRCQNYEYSLDALFQCGRDAIHGAVELRGNGQLVKREAVQSVQGWNVFSVTDDLDLSTRLHLAGWDIRFAHKVHVLEEGIAGFGPLLRQRRRWGEGCLMRYLEHAGEILFSRQVSRRVQADMIAYFVQFLLPLWLASDYAFMALMLLQGDPGNTRLMSSLVLMPIISCFFTVSMTISIYRFNRPRWGDIALGAMLTGAYMILVWMPVVFWVTVKLLFGRHKTLDWGKTVHSGALSTGCPQPAGKPTAMFSAQ